MFGCIGLCMYNMYIYNVNKNGLFGILPLKNLLLVQSTACLSNLMEKKLTPPDDLFWERNLEPFY